MQEIDQLRMRIAELTKKLIEVEETTALIEELSKKTYQEVMVPVNEIGFFEGQILNTKTVRVDLGCQTVIECSTEHALTILERKKLNIEGAIKTHEQQAQSLNQIFLPSTTLAEELNLEGSPTVEDIRETFECKTDEDVLAMLDQMERLEAEAEASEVSAQQSSSLPGLLHKPCRQVHPTQSPVSSHQPDAKSKEDGSKQKEQVGQFLGFSGDVKEHDISLQASSQQDQDPNKGSERKVSLFKKKLSELKK